MRPALTQTVVGTLAHTSTDRGFRRIYDPTPEYVYVPPAEFTPEQENIDKLMRSNHGHDGLR